MMTDTRHPSENFLRSIDVHTLLPQQEPFVMIDHLVVYNYNTTVTETTVNAQLFVDGGKLSTAGMMEVIAQTCAARIGYYNKYILKHGIQIGVIAAVKNMKVDRHPIAGEQLTTTAHIIMDIGSMTLAEVGISVGGRSVATSQVKMALTND